MSHELRTPLNAILGFGQILELDAGTPDQQSAISHILKGGHHLLSLINEVLDIARIESGRIEFSLEPVPVNHVLEESVALVQPLAAQGKVEIDLLKTTQTIEHHVLADLQRLKQVVLNLLSNAIKYNRPGGRVTVASEVAEQNRLRIAVSDTGLGISADRLEKLFIPFERIGAEHSAVEGTGLGLALSKRLVEAMGGKMGVKSTPGHGSTFWVEFPIAQTFAPDAVAELPKSYVGTETQTAGTEKSAPSRRLLYIEDNLSNVRLIERILARRPSIKLLVAMQGGLGLDLAREHRPDLILLDLNLPDIPGDELLIRLQADPRTSKIPVVIVSADATPSQISRLRTAGAADYLTKPLDVPNFLGILDRILVEPAGPPSRSPAKKSSRPDRAAEDGDGSQTPENISASSEELVSSSISELY
ncbi:MAG: ATP-binding protein [Verrucomicrobiota bacterium]|nr:ATP-binding protein [Verrucomicrobiota bacterium]